MMRAYDRSSREMRRPRARRGFTLLETVIYLALFSVIVGGLYISVYALAAYAGRNATRAAMQEEAQYIFGKSRWLLATAATVVSPQSGETGDTLSIVSDDPQTAALTICRAGSSIRYAHGGTLACQHGTSIVTEGVSVTRFSITRTDASAGRERFDLYLALRATTPNGSVIAYEASTTADAQP